MLYITWVSYLPLSYMDFLIFVGEVIWALAGFLDLLQKNPLADFLMGEFLNARDSLYTGDPRSVSYVYFFPVATSQSLAFRTDWENGSGP